jgi:hypothetical protein
MGRKNWKRKQVELLSHDQNGMQRNGIPERRPCEKSLRLK